MTGASMCYKRFLYVTILCAGVNSVHGLQKVRDLCTAAEDHLLNAFVFEARNEKEEHARARSRAVIGNVAGTLAAAGLLGHALWLRHKTKRPLIASGQLSFQHGLVAFGALGSLAFGQYYGRHVRQADRKKREEEDKKNKAELDAQRAAKKKAHDDAEAAREAKRLQDEKKKAQDDAEAERKRKEGVRECDICGVEHERSAFYTLQGWQGEQGCGHTFCKDTLNGILARVLKEKSSATLRCPDSSCKLRLVFCDVEKFATRNDAERLNAILFQENLHQGEEKERKSGVEKEVVIDCTRTNCPSVYVIIQRGDESAVVPCPVPECRRSHCSKCRKHHELRNNERVISCEEAEKRIKQKEGGGTGATGEEKKKQEEESAKWIAENTKQCPQCKTSINKNEGCNHMTCSRGNCRHEFCWICMGPWSTHGRNFYNCPFTKVCPHAGCGHTIRRTVLGTSDQERTALAKETCSKCQQDFCWECREPWPHSAHSHCEFRPPLPVEEVPAGQELTEAQCRAQFGLTLRQVQHMAIGLRTNDFRGDEARHWNGLSQAQQALVHKHFRTR